MKTDQNITIMIEFSETMTPIFNFQNFFQEHRKFSRKRTNQLLHHTTRIDRIISRRDCSFFPGKHTTKNRYFTELPCHMLSML